MTDIEPYRPREIAVRPTMETDSWVMVASDIFKLSAHIADTDFVPKNLRGKPAAVAAAMLSGREIGIGPMASLSNVRVIEGTPGLSARMMRAMVLAAGHELEYEERTNSRCRARGRRRGQDRWTEVAWTTDDARAAGLLGKDVWKKYPRRMLTARATSELCDLIFSDVLGGISYTTEELQDGGATLEREDGEPVVVEATQSAEPTRRTTQRRAKPATVDSAAAQVHEVPAPPVEQAPAGGPPLPGEDGYDEPPADQPRTEDPITKDQLTKLHTVLTEHGIADREEKLDIARRVLRQPDLQSSTKLTKQDASTLIDVLERAGQHPAGFSGYLAELLTATEAETGDGGPQ